MVRGKNHDSIVKVFLDPYICSLKGWKRVINFKKFTGVALLGHTGARARRMNVQPTLGIIGNQASQYSQQ